MTRLQDFQKNDTPGVGVLSSVIAGAKKQAKDFYHLHKLKDAGLVLQGIFKYSFQI